MTPVLVTVHEVESRGGQPGQVIRRKGKNVCFSVHWQDRKIVKEAAAEVISSMRPAKYACRGE